MTPFAQRLARECRCALRPVQWAFLDEETSLCAFESTGIRKKSQMSLQIEGDPAALACSQISVVRVLCEHREAEISL